LNYRRLLKQQLPDLRYQRFVRIYTGKHWHYFKNFNNALRAQDATLYEWLCVNEPGFDPLEVLQYMRVEPQVIKKETDATD